MFGWFKKKPSIAERVEQELSARSAALAVAARASFVPSAEYEARAKADTDALLAAMARGNYPAQRDRAVAAILARLDLMLAPHGFVRKGRVWSRRLPHGTAQIILRGRRAGTDADLRALYTADPGYQAKDRPADFHGTELGNFLRREEVVDGFRHRFAYHLMNDSPDLLDPAFAVLQERALPWLLAHGDGGFPRIEEFRDIG